MTATDIATLVVVVVFSIDAVLLVGLVTWKTIHRQRMARHDKRRAGYLALLSRHLAFPDHTDYISPREAEDSAFLDAVIDMRNTVTGPGNDTLSEITDRLGLVEREARRLRSRFPLGRRLRASVALAEMGDSNSAQVLLDHLGDPVREIRIQAARGLGRMRHTPAIDAIVARFGDEEPWVRTRFADTLVGFGGKATWPLLAYVRVNQGYADNDGVIEAIRVLGTIGDREAAPGLTELIHTSPDPDVALAAIDSVGRLGGPTTLEPLLRALESRDWRYRAKAAKAFGAIGDPSINQELVRHLEDSNWWVRRNSAASLASLPGGTDYLLSALESNDLFARDAAAEALAESGVLAESRAREAAGNATASDRLLLDHMDHPRPVPA